MRIASVDIFRVLIPFRVPFVVWRGGLPAKEHVIVRIATDSGLVGWGEAAPFLFYAPETALDVESMIVHALAPELIGRDPLAIRAIAESFAPIDGHAFAKCAIEMALWDILGKHAGLPLYQLLGGNVRDRVPLTTVLHAGEPDDLQEEAEQLVSQGFRSLKVKIGFGIDRDEAMVAAARAGAGNSVAIRVDAEEHYQVKEALALSRRLEAHDVELISQPVDRHDWEGMAFLRRAITQNLLADEGILQPHDVLTCIEHGSADMVNIKVLKAGGIIAALDMAALCGAAHLPVLIGSMIEAGPGSLFGAHLAAALQNVVSTELCGPLLLADDLLTEPVRIDAGAIVLNDCPGLGADIDETRLDRYRIT